MASREYLVVDELDDRLRALVERSVEEIEHRLHREALTEQAKRRLSERSNATHFLEFEGEALGAYAQTIEAVDVLVAEFLGDDVNDALLDLILETRRPAQSLDLWVHGVHGRYEPSVSVPAEKVRTILRLQRSLSDAPKFASSEIQIRHFEPSRDEDEWIAVNAAAFFEHPEQGSVDRVELERRMQLEWFDPSGIFLAELDGSIKGFCWTKVHRQSWGDVGEIYAIGILPDASGRGLGSILLNHAFSSMGREGLTRVMLYCEHDNFRARSLYDKLGFVEEWQDQLWRVTTS